jgi:hypothetical protein
MDRYTRTISMDVEDFYSVVNALREACGCADCHRIANDMLEQARKAVTA